MKLNKKQVGQRDEYVSKLNDAAQKLKDAIEKRNDEVDAAWDTFTSACETAWGPVEKAKEDYNNLLEEARTWVQDIASDMESKIDEKSDNWREGDRGSACVSQHDDWSGIDLDEIDLEDPDTDKPDAPDEPSLDHATNLEELPTEPNC